MPSSLLYTLPTAQSCDPTGCGGVPSFVCSNLPPFSPARPARPLERVIMSLKSRSKCPPLPIRRYTYILCIPHSCYRASSFSYLLFGLASSALSFILSSVSTHTNLTALIPPPQSPSFAISTLLFLVYALLPALISLVLAYLNMYSAIAFPLSTS